MISSVRRCSQSLGQLQQSSIACLRWQHTASIIPPLEAENDRLFTSLKDGRVLFSAVTEGLGLYGPLESEGHNEIFVDATLGGGGHTTGILCMYALVIFMINYPSVCKYNISSVCNLCRVYLAPLL